MYKIYDAAYVDGIRKILKYGKHKKDRTSVGGNTAIFGHSYHFQMYEENDDSIYMPFMQCRTFAPRIAFEELMWMLRGHTDANILKQKKIHIWDGNTSREFLDSKGLFGLPEGDIGKGYGYQMRNFNGVDQLERAFNLIKDDPTSRKNVISLWNPSELSQMALEPCHYSYTFMVSGDYLNLHQTMRSNDWLLGQPYNAAFTAFWLAIFSKALGYKPGQIFFSGTDVHLYDNQIDVANYLVENVTDVSQYKRPQIVIHKRLKTLDDVLELSWEDIEVVDWKKGDKIGNVSMAI